MQQFTDDLGLAWSATHPESIGAFNTVFEGYLASRKNVPKQLEALLGSDPEMPMAKCLRGYLLKLAADPRFATPINQIVADLNAVAPLLNEREQQHIRALTTWAANDLHMTVQILEGILKTEPRDMLALRIAHYMHFYAGAAGDLRDSVSRALKVWGKDDPFYGYLLGMHAFGLEESGDYSAAESSGKRAVEINSEDVWAAHAVTHVFQMQSRFGEGIEWLGSLLPTWHGVNNFVYHMHWHKALLHLGSGEPEAALAIYDTQLEAVIKDDFYLDVCNAASLLWRLEMLGVNVGERWEALRSWSNARVTDNELLFCTLHYLMTPARTGDEAAIRKGLDHFRHWSDEQSTQGALCRRVGLPLAEAIVCFGKGAEEQAAKIIDEVSSEIYLIGGSHAQRDLFNLFRNHSTRRDPNGLSADTL